MTPFRMVIAGVGLAGPGLSDWRAARMVLSGERRYVGGPMIEPRPRDLPAQLRRRSTRTTALALKVAEEALERAGPGVGLQTVFACASGDAEIIDRICRSLAEPARAVSPMQFHNSVHNAPSGYWSIVRADTTATTSLAAYDASFAAGLLEGLARLVDGADEVLLVAYDAPPPEPLFAHRPLPAAFGVAIRLIADPRGFAIELARGREETRLTAAGLGPLRQGVPAARALPLLEAVAIGRLDPVVLPYLPGRQLVLTPHEVWSC